jgi:ERF superfamily
MFEPSIEFYTAFASLQRELKPIKKAKSGHNWTYASLEDIWDSILPLLDKHGFVIESNRKAMACKDSYMIFLCTALIHSSSQQGIVDASPLMAYGKDNYDDQEAGENVTYQRRYALMVLLNLQMEDDKVEKRPRTTPREYSQPAPVARIQNNAPGSNTVNETTTSRVIDYTRVQSLRSFLQGFQNGPIMEKNILAFNKVTSLDQLKEDQYERALRYIKDNAAKQSSIGE